MSQGEGGAGVAPLGAGRGGIQGGYRHTQRGHMLDAIAWVTLSGYGPYRAVILSVPSSSTTSTATLSSWRPTPLRWARSSVVIDCRLEICQAHRATHDRVVARRVPGALGTER